MRCIQCGAELSEGSRFCSSCGAKQPEAEVHPRTEETAERNTADRVPVPENPASSANRPEQAREPFPPAERTAQAQPEARRVPRAADTEDQEAARQRGGYSQAGESPVPPPVEEPIAVRLTKGAVLREADTFRYGTDEEEPPQMRPVSSPAQSFRQPLPASEPGNRTVSPPAGRTAGRAERRRSVGAWIAPPLLAVCAAGALLWQVDYEREISTETTEIQRSAADAALGGNYEIAESRLKQAMAKRPDDSGIRFDLETVQNIRRLDDRLGEAQRLLSTADSAGASAILTEVEKELAGLKSGAYDRVRERLGRVREKVELVGIRSDAEKADTLDELTGLLKTASAYPAADKEPVLELINDRIVEVGGDEAEQAIASGSYYEAAAVVDEARSYVPKAERLIELEKQISSLASESESVDSELLYLSGSELTAGTGELALDGLKQRTSGEKLLISGVIRNASNHPMHELLIEFRTYDAEGTFLGEDWTEVLPNVLEPKETASFSARVEAAGDGATVIIDSVSWYRK
ncbi:FxLYD domain-containing protein [Saccharibacillus deserti]|uniref:FxLYD domain-containing protein n=1 Tax=Saccharibacillus deserti TaxID=1634444 RepID=UPI0015521D3A|nr:FxLYD domain-containing protein [Saccharibacillus deserti]